jgi:hypothetical protein
VTPAAPAARITDGDILADPAALRTRRYRLHQAGDHSLCKGCAVLRAGPAAAEGAAQVTDPVAGLRLLAGQLTAAYQAEPGNALLARELRMTLQALMPQKGSTTDDELAGLFAEFGAT